jgi:hypothetical protein
LSTGARQDKDFCTAQPSLKMQSQICFDRDPTQQTTRKRLSATCPRLPLLNNYQAGYCHRHSVA